MDKPTLYYAFGGIRQLPRALFIIGAMLIGSCAGPDQVLPGQAVVATPEVSTAVVVEQQEDKAVEQTTPPEILALTLTSPAFGDGEEIPEEFSCDGANISPALSWEGVPEGVESFALILDDPDAPGGTWVHWVLFDIPGSLMGLPGAIPAEDMLADGSKHGQNSWDRSEYGGPCPPSGTHRYYFKLYALDSLLDLETSPDAARLVAAMQGRILGETSLMGTYSR